MLVVGVTGEVTVEVPEGVGEERRMKFKPLEGGICATLITPSAEAVVVPPAVGGVIT